MKKSDWAFMLFQTLYFVMIICLGFYIQSYYGSEVASIFVFGTALGFGFLFLNKILNYLLKDYRDVLFDYDKILQLSEECSYFEHYLTHPRDSNKHKGNEAFIHATTPGLIRHLIKRNRV